MKMNRRRAKVIVPIAFALSALAALGVVALVSRAAAPKPKMSPGQLVAIAAAPRVSAAEAATVREPRHGMPTEPAADAVITAHARTTASFPHSELRPSTRCVQSASQPSGRKP